MLAEMELSQNESRKRRRRRRKLVQGLMALVALLLQVAQPSSCQLQMRRSLTGGYLARSESSAKLAAGRDTNQWADPAEGSPEAPRPVESFCQQPQTVGQRTVGSQTELDKKLFCFYDIQDDFRPQDLNPCLCTHVVYSYVAVRKNLSFIAGKKGELIWLWEPANGRLLLR